MRTILPLGEAPIIGYQFHAYRLSMMALHPQFLDYFSSNYIQLCWHPNQHMLNFYDLNQRMNPLLEELHSYKSMMNKYVSTVQFIIDCLKDGYYMVTFVNEYHIPHRSCYQKDHHIHDIMIYGYDLQKEVFHVAGYMDNKQYGYSEVSFQRFSNALEDIRPEYSGLFRWSDGMDLFRIKFEETYHFSLEMFRQLVEDYLYAHNTSRRFLMSQNELNYYYGMDTYDQVAQYIREYQGMLDIRIFHTIYEHKKGMAIKMDYLQKNQWLQDETDYSSLYEKLMDRSLSIRNLALKYNMTLNQDQLIKLQQHLLELRKEESALLTRLLNGR